MMVLMDELIENHLPKGVKVAAFLDSPYYLDLLPYNKNFKGFQYQEQQKTRLFNVQKVIPEECKAKYQGEEEWKCLYGQYRIPFIKHHYLMVASQFDAYQLGNNLGKNPPYNSQEEDYAKEFQSLTRKLLLDLYSKSKYGVSYYSWACYNHDISESLAFNYFSLISEVTQKDALEDYLISLDFFPKSKQNETKQKKYWIDICTGFECGLCDSLINFETS